MQLLMIVLKFCLYVNDRDIDPLYFINTKKSKNNIITNINNKIKIKLMLKTNNVYMFKSLSDAGWLFGWLTDWLAVIHSKNIKKPLKLKTILLFSCFHQVIYLFFCYFPIYYNFFVNNLYQQLNIVKTIIIIMIFSTNHPNKHQHHHQSTDSNS